MPFINATTVSTRIIGIEPGARATPQEDPTGVWSKRTNCHMSNLVDYASIL